MKENILIFDTETTGLLPKGAKYDTHFNEFPHIVQLAWLYNDTFPAHDAREDVLATKRCYDELIRLGVI